MSGKCEIPVPGYSKRVTFGLMESFDYPIVNSGECSQKIVKYEPHHEKTCLCHMQTTKAQISLRIHAV